MKLSRGIGRRHRESGPAIVMKTQMPAEWVVTGQNYCIGATIFSGKQSFRFSEPSFPDEFSFYVLARLDIYQFHVIVPCTNSTVCIRP